jgi:hypothetical protein
MNGQSIARWRLRRRSSGAQGDLGTILLLACACASVFACFFLIGRAASPRVQATEPVPPTLGAAVAGVPIRMSDAPAIAPAIAFPVRAPSAAAKTFASRPPAVAPVITVSTPPTPTPATTSPVAAAPPRKASKQGTPSKATTPRKPASPNGPGTSFDTSG